MPSFKAATGGIFLMLSLLEVAAFAAFLAPPTGSFIWKDKTNNVLGYIDQSGNLAISYYYSATAENIQGFVHEEATAFELEPRSQGEFIVKNVDGKVVALFDSRFAYSANWGYEMVSPTLFLAGHLTTGVQSLNPPAGSFVIRDTNNVAVAFFDGSGNLELKGQLDSRTTATGRPQQFVNHSTNPGMPNHMLEGVPDGSISVIAYEAGDEDEVQVYVPQTTTYRYRASASFAPEEFLASGTTTSGFILDPSSPAQNPSTSMKGVFGGYTGGGTCDSHTDCITNTNDFDHGGKWIYSVFRPDPQGNPDHLIGYYHAEEWYWSGECNHCPRTGYLPPAYFSIARCHSDDNGVTWQSDGQIITSSHPKPSTLGWSGEGNGTVVRDTNSGYWYCFYGDSDTQFDQVDTGNVIKVARSTDAKGDPGTWRKWTTSSGFSPGAAALGEEGSAIPALAGHAGANPHVHWNVYLQKWVMLFHTWDCNDCDDPYGWCMGETWPGDGTHKENSIHICTSSDIDDPLSWTTPIVLFQGDQDLSQVVQCPDKGTGKRFMFPTVVGITAAHGTTDQYAGYKAWVLYAKVPNKNELGERQFLKKLVHFR